MLFDYNDHSDSQVDHALRALNNPLANTGIYSAQYSEPAQQSTGNFPVQIANDMNFMAHSLSDNGDINYASTNDSRSNLTFSYDHRSSDHPNSSFLSRSDENTRRSFSHQQNSIRLNSFESDNSMVHSTVPNPREQAPPDTPLPSRVSHLTPPRQTYKRGGKLAHGGSQGNRQENVGRGKFEARLAKARTMPNCTASALQKGVL